LATTAGRAPVAKRRIPAIDEELRLVRLDPAPGQRQLLSLSPIHNPATAPMPLNNTDVYENTLTSHSSGMSAPIVEPMNIPSQIDMIF
jgi:hypothetical protein